MIISFTALLGLRSLTLLIALMSAMPNIHAFDSQSLQFDRGTNDAGAGEILLSLLSMDYFVRRCKGYVDGVIIICGIICGLITTTYSADDIIPDDNDVS